MKGLPDTLIVMRLSLIAFFGPAWYNFLVRRGILSTHRMLSFICSSALWSEIRGVVGTWRVRWWFGLKICYRFLKTLKETANISLVHFREASKPYWVLTIGHSLKDEWNRLFSTDFMKRKAVAFFITDIMKRKVVTFFGFSSQILWNVKL